MLQRLKSKVAKRTDVAEAKKQSSVKQTELKAADNPSCFFGKISHQIQENTSKSCTCIIIM